MQLWLVHGPFPTQVPKREHFENSVRTFQAIDPQTVFVLRADQKLWLERGPFGGSAQARLEVDTAVRNFSAIDANTIFVLTTDGKLWHETAPFGKLPAPRILVNSGVLAVQATTSNNLVWVLMQNRTLLLGQFPATLNVHWQNVDVDVQAFQPIDQATAVVLDITGSKLWLERAPFGTTPPTRQLIDVGVA
jgi:hypothetical protein